MSLLQDLNTSKVKNGTVAVANKCQMILDVHGRHDIENPSIFRAAYGYFLHHQLIYIYLQQGHM